MDQMTFHGPAAFPVPDDDGGGDVAFPTGVGCMFALVVSGVSWYGIYRIGRWIVETVGPLLAWFW